MVVLNVWFNKKQLSNDYAELSIGRVDYYVLRWGEVNEAYKKSTIAKDLLNNAVFVDEIESKMIALPKKKVSELSIEDGKKLRAKTKEILYRHGILKEQTKSVEGFSQEDHQAFNEDYKRMQAKIEAMNR